jgi:transposase InsO family protein
MQLLELSSAMADHIDTFYNPVRRHSSLSYLTPTEYEALHSSKTQAALS